MATTPVTMTFEQFQATGRDVPDLAVDKDVAADHFEDVTPGRVYVDGLYIERMPGNDVRRWWYLMIGNADWITHREDLRSFERRLYDYAVSEGYVVPPPTPSDVRERWVKTLELARGVMIELRDDDGLRAMDAAIDSAKYRR